ncbi:MULTISPECIES: TonB-dependent receptor [Butyricimonas]|mgnify:FL=1|uniref:TonB-dependent receptor n=1 Tax=Butyricimonas TaxID=574697 RepID=UPI001D0661EC|nr:MULTISPECIES: TonB-dependent receptor [Butyricimonas]MCB6972158.1 TonB-dependent receptor [Butyricimonas synergistica]MCG4519279.1 TonB-dependent receptor [Butyricimonas sp. DFI.6.44]
MKKFVALTTLFVVALASIAFAEITLKGKVVDAKTGKALAGANVRLVGTSIGIATNNKGEFILEKIPDGTYTLRASYSGYEVGSMKVNGNKSDILFQLLATPVNLNQVVVTGTGTHRRLKDSPVPVEVISGSDLRQAGVNSFEDALLLLNPAFNIRPTVMGSYFTLNGMSNKYILILVDGKKVAGDVSNNTDLSRIDMGRVKRVEILKGAASALYGSDAIAGVINVITEQPKDPISVQSKTRFGGESSFSQNAGVDLNFGKFTSSTSYQRRQMGGWQLNPNEISGDTVIPTRSESSSKFHSNIITQHFTYAPNEQLKLYAQGSYFNREVNRPVQEKKNDGAYQYDLTYMDYNFGLGGKYFMNDGAYISLDLYMDNYEYNKLYTVAQLDKKDTTFRVGDEELTKRQKYYNGNLKGVFRVGGYNKLTLGTEYANDYMKNPGSLDEPKEIYTLAVYAQDEIRVWKNLQILPGFRYVYNEMFKNRFTPKIALMYTLGSFNFRTSYAAGFKTPSIQELYYDYENRGAITIGNPDLKPEKANYYNVNVEYTGKYLNISANGYINDVKDIIEKYDIGATDEDKANGIKTRNVYHNLDKASIKGFDISVNSYLGAGFSAAGAYNCVYAADGEGRRLSESVRHAATFRGGWTHEWNKYRLHVNVNGRIQGSKYIYKVDSKTGKITDTSAPKYQLWNLATTHTFAPVGNFLFELNAGIDNLFDWTDDRPNGVNYATLNPGRTFFASLVIRFTK